jgi:CDP-glucose 4,6-dehydratase
MFSNKYSNKNVLVTGHTGFKGSWLSQWLLELGANVSGIALDPNENQLLYSDLRLSKQIKYDCRSDIRSLETISKVIKETNPSIIFHLAAQPLVKDSYAIPLETCSVIVVTTDKCYQNNEWIYGYRENEKLGGDDPYSASKGGTEIIVNSYQKSFFKDSNVKLASVRAGNVLGGGDWSKDRIFPDSMRSIKHNKTLKVRNIHATRPWQHVLEPLSGYLWLGACLEDPTLSNANNSALLTSGFNFGPEIRSNKSVEELVKKILAYFPEGNWENTFKTNALYEASKLNLAIDKAYHLLNWNPIWDFDKTIEITCDWYKGEMKNKDLKKITVQQINQYTDDARKSGIRWAIT